MFKKRQLVFNVRCNEYGVCNGLNIQAASETEAEKLVNLHNARFHSGQKKAYYSEVI